MDSISPLAKILAEANGIDWRSLQGSGAGGSVVEQDILNYLSRIMSGDEEPPATPVDEAPPGWTGEMPPMPVAISGLEALSAAGVESDITDFVAQQSQAAQTVSAQTVSAQTLSGQTLPVQPVPSESAPAQSAATPPAPEFGSVTAVPVRRSASNDDLEFELDDLDDDSAADDLTPADLTPADLTAADHLPDDSGLDPAAQPSVGTPVYENAPIHEPIHEDVPAQPVARPGFGSAAVYGAAEVHASEVGDTAPGQPVHSELVLPQDTQPEPAQFQQPAYDPVALDADSDFVMAEQVVASQPAESGQPAANSQAAEDGLPEYGRPTGNEQAAGTAEVAAISGGAAGLGLGGFLSRLYGGKAKAEAAAGAKDNIQVANAKPSSAESAGPLVAGSGFAAPALHGPNLGEALIPQAPPISDTPVAAPLVADQWRDQELTGPELPALALTELPHTELGQPTDLPEAHESMDHEANQEANSNQEADSEVQPLTDHQVMSEDGSDAAAPRAAFKMPAPVAPTPEVSFSEQPVSEQPADRSPSWTDAALPLGVAAGVGAAAAGLAAADLGAQDLGAQHPDTAPAHAEPPAPVTATSVSALSPVSHAAMTLRLNLDLHALETARAQLSTALMRDVPLGLLVARAAARSLSTLGLHASEGAAEGVALANHAGQPLATDLRADFRASLEGLGHAAQAQPTLLVLDASALGLDELHRGECSLSVGRTSSDGAVLSLRGDLDPARGAQFLHEVAGLLGTPILLLF